MPAIRPDSAAHVDEAICNAQSGSIQAFTVLYETFAGDIASFANARGVQHVDELVNDVFLGAFRALGRFEGDAAAFRAYLYRIARNKIVDSRAVEFRDRDRWTSLEAMSIDITDPARTHDVEEAVLTDLDARELRVLLEMLTADQRDVILLRFLSGLTVTEVSNVIGKRPSAIKALQRRGLAALRRFSSRGGVSV